jgi:PAS domain S-box-containing protein
MATFFLTSHLYYVELYGNAILALCFLLVLPWLVYRVLPSVSWMQPIQHMTGVFIGFSLAFGMLMAMDFMNVLFHQRASFTIWKQAIGSTVFMGMLIGSHIKWPWLNRLYPEEAFIAQVLDNNNLIAKQVAMDEVNPTARFESRDGAILDANPAAELLTGYTLAEMVCSQPGFLVHPDDYEKWREHIMQQSTAIYEARLINKIGRVLNVEVHSVLAPYDTKLRITFVKDVTHYKEELDTLIRSRQRTLQKEERREVVASVLQAAHNSSVEEDNQ